MTRKMKKVNRQGEMKWKIGEGEGRNGEGEMEGGEMSKRVEREAYCPLISQHPTKLEKSRHITMTGKRKKERKKERKRERERERER